MEPSDLRRRVAVLWLVVFVDLLGFGLLIPLIPFYAERLGLSPGWITFVIALHSLAQFMAAPGIGRLSDRYGRRPVLALSMAGHALAYAMLAFADHLAVLVLSRLLSGATSANLTAAYAYVSDITPPERRQEGFARISAAFALGFALGPALGGLLSDPQNPTQANLDPPALAAAALSAIAFIGILLFLPESHLSARRGLPSSAPSIAVGAPVGRATPAADFGLRLLFALGVLVFVFASMRESILSLWLHDRFAFDTHTIGIVFMINGLMIAAVQSFATGPLGRRFGALATLRAGIVCYGLSWLGLVLAPGLVVVGIAIAAGALGTALFGTSLQTLVSMRAGTTNRGAILGRHQSLSSLARFAGAAGAGTLFAMFGRDMPFVLGALAMLPALALTLSIARRLGPAAAATTTGRSA